MTVKVGISADPSGGVSAFNQISAAIRKAGQEGRKLSELDFSHPELKDLEDDIDRLQDNFKELQKVGRGATAAAVRQGGYDDVISWHAGYGRQFPDAKQRQNHFDAVSNYTTQGTRWGAPPPGGNPPGTGGSSGFGFSGIPVPGIGKLLGIGLGLAGIGKVTGMLSEGVTGAADESVQVDTLKRIIGDTSTEFSDLRQSIREAGEGLQLTYAETVKLAQSFAKASNYADSHRITEEVKTSAGFARSFGLDPSHVTRSFGESRFLQVGGGSDTSPKEMAVMFADAIAAGGMWSKADEVMNSIIGWVQQAERVTIDAPNVRAYAELSSSMNASERPGLQGQAGAALISQIDQSIRGGGGAGDAGRNFLWRAINADGKLSPYQMKFMLEKGGMFGKLPDGRTNFEAVNDLAKQQYANPLQRADALSNLFNTSMSQMMAMMDLKPGSHGALGEMIKKYNIDPENIDSTSYQGLADVATANGSRLEVLRDDLLKRDDLTGTQKRTVRNASGEDGLRRALATTIALAGREQTTGIKTLDGITAIKNALTNSAGPLLSPINEIRDFTAQMVKSPVDKTENIIQGLLRNTIGSLVDTSTHHKRPPGRQGPGGASDINYINAVPEFADQREIKLVNEIVFVHKNDKGGVIDKEDLPSETVQIRAY